MSVLTQAEALCVGLAETNARVPPTATHSERDRHVTSVRGVELRCTGRHVPGPPVGLVEISASPAWATTTQRLLDAHEIASRLAATCTTCHSAGPADGLVELAMSPESSIATHKPLKEHETPVRAPTPGSTPADQAAGPPAGLVVVATYPGPDGKHPTPQAAP